MRNSGERASILIVDDEEDIREALSFLFAMENYDVVAVDSGNAAVEAARGRSFDLAITDLRMPGMSGPETITALKAVDPSLPVMVATGYASEETTADCQRRGALEAIKKPFDSDLLLRRVREIIA